MRIIYIMFEAACIYLLQRVLYKKYWNKFLDSAIAWMEQKVFL